MRATRLASVLAVLALLLMACETDEPAATDTPEATPTPAEPTPGVEGDVDEAVLDRVVIAAGNTVDEGTARFTIEARSATGTGTGTGTDSGTGTDTGTGTDSDTGTDTDTGSRTAGGDAVVVEGEVDFDEELRELQFMGPQGQLTAIVDGDELYIQLPATEEGEYARIDLNELFDAEVGFGGPAGIPFQDPQRTLESLREAVIEARVLDDDGLDATPTPGVDATPTPDDGGLDATPTPGVDATPTPDDGGLDATPTPTPDAAGAEDARHLLVVIDLERAADSANARHFAAMAEQYGIETIDMEIWIDEQDRIEQIAYTLPLSQARIEDDDLDDDATDDGAVDAEVDPQEDLVVTIAYYDFGGPVNITVPDEDSVIDLDEQELRRSLPTDGRAAPGATPAPTSTPTPTPDDDDPFGDDDTDATPTPTPTPDDDEAGG